MTIKSYPELFAALGCVTGTLCKKPDLINRVAWGSATPGQIKTAGLPNITGNYSPHYSKSFVNNPGSALYSIPMSNFQTAPVSGTGYGTAFDASRCNSIYGNSTTVQPPAYTVKFLIRAKP